MVLTTETVASQAFAEHLIRLNLPPCIEASLAAWSATWHCTMIGTTGKTRLDIESASRHEVLRSKQVIIGCGGGFRHECANRYSPVAQWMSEVDLALQDESQQYGNLDEAAAIARMPHISVWLSGLVTTGKPQVASVNPNLQGSLDKNCFGGQWL